MRPLRGLQETRVATREESGAMRETWVRFLGWEDPLEEGMAIHSSILAWRTPMDREAWRGTVHGPCRAPAEPVATPGYSPWGCKESDTTEHTTQKQATRGTLLRQA